MNNRIAPIGGPVTEEPSGTLFVPGYLFDGVDVTQGGDPGQALDAAALAAPGNPVDTTPPWMTRPAVSTPVYGGPSGGNSQWILWPASGPPTRQIKLPNGADIRSLWVPNVPFLFGIAIGTASGSPMYSVTQVGGETIPIPEGNALLQLYANPLILRKDVWV